MIIINLSVCVNSSTYLSLQMSMVPLQWKTLFIFRDSTNKYEVLAKMALNDSHVIFFVFVVAVVIVF